MRLPVLLLLMVAWLAAAVPARAEPALEKRGCVACHSLDGSPSRGPSFRGLAGASRPVLQNGARAAVTADREYLARSILTPDSDVVEGYPAGSMPAFKLAEGDVRALVEEIQAVPADGSPPAPRSLWLLLASTVVFVGFHILLSSLPSGRRSSSAWARAHSRAYTP